MKSDHRPTRDRATEPSAHAHAPTSPTARDLAVRRLDFEGRPVTAVMFRGRWLWRGAEVGEAVGYEQGRTLVDNVRGAWASDFREGHDFELLRGDDLKAFKATLQRSLESAAVDRTPAVLVLTASGVDLALVLAQTDKGRRLRRLLVDHVLPQLRATGTATLPGAPPPALDAEALKALVAQTVAEQLRAFVPPAPPPASPVLDRRDRAAALGPILRMARVAAGPGAAAREVSRERGRIEHRVRLALRWDARWCLFPAAREGELVLALREEERLVDRIAERAARDRQLALRPVGAGAR